MNQSEFDKRYRREFLAIAARMYGQPADIVLAEFKLIEGKNAMGMNETGKGQGVEARRNGPMDQLLSAAMATDELSQRVQLAVEERIGRLVGVSEDRLPERPEHADEASIMSEMMNHLQNVQASLHAIQDQVTRL